MLVLLINVNNGKQILNVLIFTLIPIIFDTTVYRLFMI